MEQTTTLLACPQCGQSLPADALACPDCGALVNRSRLEQLSSEALSLEQTDPLTALRIWRQALDLLPIESPQYRMIYDRMAILANKMGLDTGNGQPSPTGSFSPSAPAARDNWGTAILKTVGSMIVSIIIYAYFMQNAYFAAGFVLLILVHEMGHVVAMRYYNLNASPPIFIPFVGALINLRQQPPNAKVEAIVGIGGPIAGTVAALVCFIAYKIYPGHPILLELAFWGFFLNLFNLIPVPPLDGGRITAAVSPWIWMLGIVVIVAIIVARWIFERQISFILLLVLFYAWPRIKATFHGRQRDNPYYRISRTASVTIGVAYLLLGATLLGLMTYIVLSQAHFILL